MKKLKSIISLALSVLVVASLFGCRTVDMPIHTDVNTSDIVSGDTAVDFLTDEVTDAVTDEVTDAVTDEVTDAVTDKVTEPDLEPEKYMPQFVPADSEYDLTPPSEEKMAELYQKAVTAKGKGQVQYAYGLFSRLGVEDFCDSRQQAAELRTEAYAVKYVGYIEYYVDDAGFKYMDSPGEQAVFLDPEGVPVVMLDRYDTGELEVSVPEPEHKGIVSLCPIEIENIASFLALCITSDGRVEFFGDKDPFFYEGCEGAVKYVDALREYVEGLRDVVKISTYFDAILFLHKDGSVSFTTAHRNAYKSYSTRLSEMQEEWVDIVDMGQFDVSGKGFALLRADGTLVGFKINNGLPVRREYDSEKISMLAGLENIVINGRLNSYWTNITNGVGLVPSDIVWARGLKIDSNGAIITTSCKILKEDDTSAAYVGHLDDYRLLHFGGVVTIDNNGKISTAFSENSVGGGYSYAKFDNYVKSLDWNVLLG